MVDVGLSAHNCDHRSAGVGSRIDCTEVLVGTELLHSQPTCVLYGGCLRCSATHAQPLGLRCLLELAASSTL